MNRILWVKWVCVLVLGASIAVLEIGCKKDESNPVTPGGGGLTTFNFTTPNQTFNMAAATGATRARLTGGTLPYVVTGNSNSSVATASFSNDTLTVTPLAPGATALTIADSLGMLQDRTVTITINVTGGGSGGYGSGAVTVTSPVGPLSIAGTGVWPAGAGPSVVAVFDTLRNVLVVLAYQQVSGSHYNLVVLQIGGITQGTYLANHTAAYQVGYNADTSAVNIQTYTSVNDSASVVISSVNGQNLVGSYSGLARLGVNSSVAMGGGFNIVYTRGLSPINIGGRAAPLRVSDLRQTPDTGRPRH